MLECETIVRVDDEEQRLSHEWMQIPWIQTVGEIMKMLNINSFLVISDYEISGVDGDPGKYQYSGSNFLFSVLLHRVSPIIFSFPGLKFINALGHREISPYG